MDNTTDISSLPTESQEFSEDPYSMTEEKLRLRALTVNRGSYAPQLYCALTGAVCFGIVLGWSCPAIRQQLEKHTNDTSFPAVAGLAPLGASIGCALLQVLSERRGPKTVVLVICPIQVTVWIIIASVKSESVYKWMIFCSGLLSIGFILCGETLLWDSVHTGYSSSFRVLFESSTTLGVLISYIIGLKVNEATYFSVAGAILVTITFIMYFFIPESPVFLYGKNPLKAEKALTFLRGETNIYDDMRHIKKDYELRSIDISAKYMFIKRVVYKAVLIILGVTFFSEFSGYYALLAFGLTILSEQGGEDDKTPIDVYGKFEDGLILGLFFYISRVLSCFILGRGNYGVRTPILTSSIMTTIGLILMTIFFYLNDVLFIVPKSYEHLKILVNCYIIFSYDIGYNLTPSVILYDYLPFQVYPWVKLLQMSFRWLCIYLMVIIIITIGIDDHTTWINYLVLTGVSFVGIIFNFIFVIESKGKTLMQIQNELGGNPVGSRSSRRNKRVILPG